MKIHYLIIMSVLIEGCSTMNSNFSCDATASDACLTIEEVDEMTRFANDAAPCTIVNAKKGQTQSLGYLVKNNKGQPIWLTQNIKDKSWT